MESIRLLDWIIGQMFYTNQPLKWYSSPTDLTFEGNQMVLQNKKLLSLSANFTNKNYFSKLLNKGSLYYKLKI